MSVYKCIMCPFMIESCKNYCIYDNKCFCYKKQTYIVCNMCRNTDNMLKKYKDKFIGELFTTIVNDNQNFGELSKIVFGDIINKYC